MRRFAVGIVTKNRWELTKGVLDALYYSNQPKSDFDLFVVDNGSDEGDLNALKTYLKTGLLEVRNIVCMSNVSVPVAWNLFFALSKDYEYRIKMDNDVVLHNTIVPSAKKNFTVERKTTPDSSPDHVDPMAGAPKSGPPIRGLGQISKKSRRKMVSDKTHSSFLDHMTEFSEQYNIDITSLVPVSPNQIFVSMYHTLVSARFHGNPYLFGACMMVNKRAFDTLQYFDERLPRRIDIEYSQRAIRNKLNIGYHPFYGVTHIGAARSTEPRDEIDQKYLEADRIQQSEPPIKTAAETIWTPFLDKIMGECKKNKIVTIT